MYGIKITAKRLNELRMLAEWQLRELGIDPQSVNEACREYDDKCEQRKAADMAYLRNRELAE